MDSFSFPGNVTKRWADYNPDDPLPVIPWAPHINQSTHKPDSSGWTTVKIKKKNR